MSEILQRYYYRHLGTKLTRSEVAVLGGGDSTPGGSTDVLTDDDEVTALLDDDSATYLTDD